MADNFAQVQKECEDSIRSGDVARAQKILSKIKLKNLARGEVATYARLARRSHLWNLSLSALKPIVRPKVKVRAEPSLGEWLEYAIALQRAGALSEADRILLALNPDQEPRVHLGRAFVAMARWDYESAKLNLEFFLGNSSIDPYERRIAELNRFACLAESGSSQIEAASVELEKGLKKDKLQLLLGSFYEISAQYFISQQKWKDAQGALERSVSLLEKESGTSRLYAEKWTRILKAIKSKAVSDLEEFRKTVLAQGDWETLRHLDYYQVMLDPSSPWANFVYFGTPYASFRKKLEMHRSFESETWVSRRAGASEAFDPWFPGDAEGDIAHRLTVILLRDFYRPSRVGEIFSMLYPDQYFDMDSSATRVRVAMSRTRKWLEKNKIPLTIVEKDQLYSLRMSPKASIKCRTQAIDFEKTRFIFSRYWGLQTEKIGSAEWAKILKLSAAQTRHLLNEAIEAGAIVKFGSGTYTRYKVAP